jgi:hypothetical protein
MLDSGHTKSVPRRSLSSPQPRTFHIGIDFGMTYSAVSGAITCPDDLRPPRWDDVFHINHWNAVDPLDTQVPSEMWYPANIPNPANESNDGDILWGYEVGEELYRGMTTRSREYIMRWLKEWFLDESTIPQEHLDELATKLALLYQTGITRKHIRTNTSQERDLRDAQESVSHYLTKILAHTRSRLKLVHKLKDSDIVKYVLTVPAIWSHRASRVLQSALEEAILASGLGRLSYGSIDDLFIANEPESAATWLVEIYGHSSFQV